MLFLSSFLFISYLLVMFIITHYKKDISIGNFTWGGGVILLTVLSFLNSTYLPRHILITVLILTWGLRLSFFIWLRYKKGADPRYVTWQDQTGPLAFLFALFWIFALNGVYALVMSTPSLVVNKSFAAGLTVLDLLGVAIWLIGFYFESVGDYQLFSFTRKPKNYGKIMDQGLWKYTRHPNYFGEICMWWGIYAIALSVEYGWLTIIAPLSITILLIFFTGIPMNEKVFEDNKEYQAYKKKTSALIPWFPKES